VNATTKLALEKTYSGSALVASSYNSVPLTTQCESPSSELRTRKRGMMQSYKLKERGESRRKGKSLLERKSRTTKGLKEGGKKRKRRKGGESILT